MKHVDRAVAMAPAVCLVFWMACLGAAPLCAQDSPEATPETQSAELSRKERKRQAKEARIEEYLRRKEERRAQRELRAKLTAAVEAEAPVPGAIPPPITPATARNRQAPVRGAARLPRNLARAQENVRATALARDPTVQGYLAMIDQQQASAFQLAAFGNFLADNGLLGDALEYYDIALNLEPENALFWLNYGTLHRQNGDTGNALSAYNRVLSLDPNNAMAYYNIGAILENQGKYEASIEAYKQALSLDPSLGDPAYNPQVVNSERLLAVKLLLYREQAGSRGLPLEEVPLAQALPEEPPPPPPPLQDGEPEQEQGQEPGRD